MPELVFVVNNTFVNSSVTSNQLGITAFNRVFNKLIKKDGPLGKVHPIYFEVNESLKVLGVLTLNVGGSYSFFPELPGNPEFDHLTFVKNFEGRHHFTKVSTQGNEKILPITAQLLTNGTLYCTTFMINDISLLKDVPKIVEYPVIDFKKLEWVRSAFFTDGKGEGSTILKNSSTTGTLCIQLFLIPKAVDLKKLNLYSQPITNMIGEVVKDDTSVFHAVIPHEYQEDYSLGIVYFRLKKELEHPFLILSSTLKDGFYTKIPIRRKRSTK